MVPESITKTLSESIMVFNLWATVSTVQFANFLLIVFWIRASVLEKIVYLKHTIYCFFVVCDWSTNHKLTHCAVI